MPTRSLRYGQQTDAHPELSIATLHFRLRLPSLQAALPACPHWLLQKLLEQHVVQAGTPTNAEHPAALPSPGQLEEGIVVVVVLVAVGQQTEAHAELLSATAQFALRLASVQPALPACAH